MAHVLRNKKEYRKTKPGYKRPCRPLQRRPFPRLCPRCVAPSAPSPSRAVRYPLRVGPPSPSCARRWSLAHTTNGRSRILCRHVSPTLLFTAKYLNILHRLSISAKMRSSQGTSLHTTSSPRSTTRCQRHGMRRTPCVSRSLIPSCSYSLRATAPSCQRRAPGSVRTRRPAWMRAGGEGGRDSCADS